MKSLYIKDLQKNQVISNENFLIFENEKSSGKDGKTYCSIVLGDKTGKLPGKIWNDRLIMIDENILKKGTVVSVSGKVDEFKGNLQVIVFDMQPAAQEALDDFLQTSEYNADEMMQNLMQHIENIKNKDIKALLTKIVTDEEINNKLKYWPAAASVHHDFRSGLLQHILEMLEIANSMRKFYPNVNYDILNAGVILHDIGKIYELEASTITTEYSKEGMLIGHIVRGVMLLESFGGKSLPEDIYLHLIHLILSHHGSREFGSPVLPSTVEAIMLTYIDNLSAKTRSAVKAKNSIIAGEDFGAYNNILSGVRLWHGGDLVSSEDEDEQSSDPETEVSDEELGQLTF